MTHPQSSRDHQNAIAPDNHAISASAFYPTSFSHSQREQKESQQRIAARKTSAPKERHRSDRGQKPIRQRPHGTTPLRERPVYRARPRPPQVSEQQGGQSSVSSPRPV